ncbi:GDT1-like protein 1, chloroplastic isoform X2 [Prosopis cineraria]|uniref:GDT1-like protein 1, chloroplastic isoform X2 n=1 Tax=Prosopis cineraria TaxID=364024 RepID=UPI00240F7DAF|nr:GDT1-like protein 1, chloroplastic isoform X2 [Prosopis cineraria]
MRGLTLSESILRLHSLPSFLYIPKPFTCSLLSSNSHSKKHTSKLALEFPTSNSSRYSQRYAGTFKQRPYYNLQQGFQKLRDPGKLSHVYKNGDAMSNCSNSNILVVENSNQEYYVATEVSFNSSSSGLLKFMILFGLLTFQDSYPAAASDLASGFNSVPILGDLGDISTGFASAFLLIFFSELGDKTFFIAALLAARNSAAVTFIGTFGALAAMTIVSVVLGRTFHYVDEILPFRFGETDLPVDDIAAVCLLVYFGISTLLDASSSDGQSEDEQKEAELAVSEFSGNGAGILAAASTVVSTFLLVFVAEWGDKSFFSTIALAAASSPLGVIGGALAGHGVATLLAVLGGSLLGTFLSEKVIAFIGGSLFLVFAAVTLFEIVN